MLELPLSDAALAAAQTTDDGIVSVASVAPDGSGAIRLHDVALAELTSGYARARAWFGASPERHFAAYLAGTLSALSVERQPPASGRGIRLLVISSVPEGSGVSSSAAVTVAAMSAVCGALAERIAALDLALYCQKVENLVAGAPSGVMDPMTAALGQPGRLLELSCQPAEVRGHLPLPDGMELWGIDSGVRHHVAGAEYLTVRTATFMGKRILRELVGASFPTYLATFGASRLQQHASALPGTLLGSEFLARHGATDDELTTVEPDRSYPVRAATVHPILEHERVTRFAALLREPFGRGHLLELGALMDASDASYSACGLGSPATDRLLELVRNAGPYAGLYGAKVTGGGSGGTVAVLAEKGARAEVVRVAERYAEAASVSPRLFEGSSPGAAAFGVLAVQLGREGRRLLPVFV